MEDLMTKSEYSEYLLKRCEGIFEEILKGKGVASTDELLLKEISNLLKQIKEQWLELS